MAFWQWRRDEERKKPKVPAQSLHEPIIAYRAWRIAESRLVSCTCDCVWQPRERMDAHCNHKGAMHEARAPVWECSCGFYAYKTDAALTASEYLGVAGGFTVGGRVALWGRVIDHELGYRAERAYPQVLYLRGDRLDDLIKRLADCYAVECMPRHLSV